MQVACSKPEMAKTNIKKWSNAAVCDPFVTAVCHPLICGV